MLASVLVIGSSDQSDEVVTALGARGHRVVKTRAPTATAETGPAALRVLFLPLTGRQGATLIRQFSAAQACTPLLVAGCDETIGSPPEAISLGATDHVPDPSDREMLLRFVNSLLRTGRTEGQLYYPEERPGQAVRWSPIAGECAAMREVYAAAHRICRRSETGAPPSVLITGETGTGKSLLAKAIHAHGARRRRAFVDINCASLPPSLVESELFGYAQGAFTDAKGSRAGLFETAHGGTILLDEITSLPLGLQAKLLAVLEEKKVRRLGSNRDVPFDAQVISASNEDLEILVRTGAFRADLYHRINVIELRLPPLRERGDDRGLLAELLLRSICAEQGIEPKRLHSSALSAIGAYHWPGNVRELKNHLERIALLVSGTEIRAEDLRSVSQYPPAPPPESLHALQLGGESAALSINLPKGGCPLDALEQQVIRGALQMHSGNVSRTARYLSISRHKLIYRMRKHGLRHVEEGTGH